MLEIILDIKIKRIVYIEPQMSLELMPNGRGVRLDVYVEDEAESVYDIEMQTGKTSDSLGKRSRYYQSMIDVHLIERGQKYSDLRKSFIIFICRFDPFGLGLPRYTFTPICQEESSLHLEDGTTRIFVNTTAETFTKNQEALRSLTDYFEDATITSDYTSELDKKVYEARIGGKWRLDYMTLEMKIQEEREKAKQEGYDAGLSQGKLIIIKSLVDNNILSIADAANSYGVPENEMSHILKTIK